MQCMLHINNRVTQNHKSASCRHTFINADGQMQEYVYIDSENDVDPETRDNVWA